MSKTIKTSSGDLSTINPYMHKYAKQEVDTWVIVREKGKTAKCFPCTKKL